MTDWRTLYPFESQGLTVEGHRWHYVDEGPRLADTPTLVLVHGNPTWSFYWRNAITAWSTRYRVIAVDQLGCGLSDKPPDGPYRLADRVRQLGKFLTGLQLRHVTLIGHDWGGAIATGAALEHRDRVARLGLLNTGAFRSDKIPWRIAVCRWPIFGPLAVRGLNAFQIAAFSMAVEQRQNLTPLVRAGYAAPYGSWAERVAIQRFVEDIPLSPRHPSYAKLAEIEAGLPSLGDMPKLLIWGMRDWCFTPWFLEQFERVWPEAEVERIADAGHWVLEDAPDRVIRRVAHWVG
ncbi:MAG: alpha/beta fold hydrolase [Pirellulales bacterium]|nr:alpha/beta fold hydrolase [Pirellulales bacterium]